MANTASGDTPPFFGFVNTTLHALHLVYAARQGVIPRITRRLSDTERKSMIGSGSVFVFSVEESGIKRWTDGLVWSPSRIVGNFLVYREISERSPGRGGNKRSHLVEEVSHQSKSFHAVLRNQRENSPRAHQSNAASRTDQGTLKFGGLIKKTITVNIDGSDLHLISYYTSEDVGSNRLRTPSSRPDIMGLYMHPSIFRFSNFRNPLKTELGLDGRPRLVCESGDENVEFRGDTSAIQVAARNWGSENTNVGRLSVLSRTYETSQISLSTAVQPSLSSLVGGDYSVNHHPDRFPLHHASWSLPYTGDAHPRNLNYREDASPSAFLGNSTSWSSQSYPHQWQAESCGLLSNSPETFTARIRQRTHTPYRTISPVRVEPPSIYGAISDKGQTLNSARPPLPTSSTTENRVYCGQDTSISSYPSLANSEGYPSSHSYSVTSAHNPTWSPTSAGSTGSSNKFTCVYGDDYDRKF